LALWKTDVEGVAIVEFGMDQGGGNSAGSFVIETRTNAAEVTNMNKAAFG
jgi:hypothetical protein